MHRSFEGLFVKMKMRFELVRRAGTVMHLEISPISLKYSIETREEMRAQLSTLASCQ